MRTQADEAVANFFFGTGVAFNVASNLYFKQMLARVGEYGPGYMAPCCSTIGTVLLDKAVKSVVQDLSLHGRNSAKFGVTLTSDGWSNTTNRCICACVACVRSCCCVCDCASVHVEWQATGEANGGVLYHDLKLRMPASCHAGRCSTF